MRPLLILVLALAAGAACASSKSTTEDDKAPRGADPGGMPFIKLAKRELGLVVFWVGPSPSPAAEESLQRELARRLTTTYREPLFEYQRSGEFNGFFDPALYVDLAQHGVDDAVVVEASAAGAGEASRPLRGRVRIITLNDEKTVLDATVPPDEAGVGEALVPRFADRVWLVVAKNWTDPAAGPPLNPAMVADRLAERGACAEAIRIYNSQKTHERKPRTVAEAQALELSNLRRVKCRDELAIKEALEKDRTAVFGLTVSANGLAPDIKTALEAAASARSVRATLEKLTDKPVLVEATTDSIALLLRYHPDRYQRMTGSKAKYVMNQRALYLEPYVAAMNALSNIRDIAADKLPPYDAPLVKKLITTLKLVRLPDDRVEIDFAEIDGRVVLTDTLHIKVGARPETTVQTPAKSLLRDHVYVLGPPRDVSGELTNFGLVYKFFELE